MKTKTILAYAAAATLLAIVPSTQADPNAPVKPATMTGKLVYANGKPAADATVVLDLINNTTHVVTTHTFKADQNGTVNVSIDPTTFATSTRCIYMISPTGFGFGNYSSPNSISTSTLLPFTTVRVHLVDSNGKLIAHVQVCPRNLVIVGTYYGHWNDYIPGAWTQTTDAAGYATLPKLPQGFTMSLDVLDDRYAAPDLKSDIQLANAAISPDATVQVNPSSSIAGTVVYGSTNKPVAGILVRATSTSTFDVGGLVVTSANGSYLLTRLAVGTYKVAAQAGRGDFKEWVAPFQTVAVDTGAHSSGNKLTIVHGGVISGKVTDKATGAPIPRIYVIMTPHSADGRSTFGTGVITDVDGTYSLRLLPGKVNVVPSGQSSPLGGVTSQSVEVSEGETKTIDFQIEAPFAPTAVHGVVLDPNGKPVSGAEVFTVNDQDQSQDAITDTQGRFTLDSPGLLPNALILAREGSLPANLATASPVPYKGGSSVTLNLIAGTLCTVKGQVKDQNGKSVPNAPVTLYLHQGMQWNVIDQSKSDATGQYAFPSSFAHEAYTVGASPSGYTSGSSGTVEVTTSQTVQVPPIVVTVADSFIGGTVVDARGKPIANARINVNNVTDGYAATDQDGHFTIKSVPPGKVSVWVSIPGGSSVTQDLIAGQSDNTVTMPAEVNGIVLGPDNKPVSGAQVLASDDNQTYQTTTADSSGQFSFQNPGLKLKSQIIARSLTGDLGTASALVYSGEDQLSLHLTPGNLSPITGQIKSIDGSPVANAALSLSLMVNYSGVEIDKTHTDAQGNYTFPPCFTHSKYYIDVQAPGYGSSGAEYTTTDAQHALPVPPITLKPADSFAGGTVFDSKGTPAAGITVNDGDVQGVQTTTDQAGHFILHGVPRDKTSINIQTPDGTNTSQDLTSGRGDNVVYLPKPNAK